MKAYIIIVGFLLSMCGAAAQQEFIFTFDKEGRAISIPKPKKFDIHVPAYSYKPYAPEARLPVDLRATELSNSWAPSLGELPMNVRVLSSAYQPLFNPYTPMMRRMSPFSLDFRETSVVPVNEKLALVATGQHATFPLLGWQTDISSMLFWQHQRLTIGGGVFAGRFAVLPDITSVESMAGASLRMRFELSDRFALRGWGNYTIYSGKQQLNPYLFTNPYYNHTGVGGALEYMFNENFGVGGGVDYQFNYRKGRLEPRPIYYPIIKTGGVKIGVRH